MPVVLAFLSGLATVHTCLPVSGTWAQMGLRLALLHPDAACPQGTLAVGATTGQAMTVVVAVAVPAVLAHLALISGAAGLVGSVRRVILAAAHRVSRALAPSAPRHPDLPTAPGPVVRPAAVPVRTVASRRPHRRGPPVLAGTLG